MVDWPPISKGIAPSVDDLLTTKQLQDLLQVDRITIYRMLNDGRLHGFKVGGQWRFSRQEIEAWLHEQRMDLEAAQELRSAGGTALPSSKVLSISCVQAIQDVCAEALDVAAVTIDLDGALLTDISNSCDFCKLILSTGEGQRRCAAAWRTLGNRHAHPCHAGLLCVSVPVEVSGRIVAITASCQFAAGPVNDDDQVWVADLSALAADLGLSETDLKTAAERVRLVPQDYLPRVTRLFRRMADTLSEIGQERLNLLSRLQHIAEMSKI
jgi:excisionase family DNA binding protein